MPYTCRFIIKDICTFVSRYFKVCEILFNKKMCLPSLPKGLKTLSSWKHLFVTMTIYIVRRGLMKERIKSTIPEKF